NPCCNHQSLASLEEGDATTRFRKRNCRFYCLAARYARSAAVKNRAHRVPGTGTGCCSIEPGEGAAGGAYRLAKSIATTGRSNVTEHELTQLVVDAAKREHPDLSDAQAFAKVFGAATPEGEMLRKAIAVAKAAQLEIMPDATEGGDTDVQDH